MTAKEYLEELAALRKDLIFYRAMLSNCHLEYDSMRGIDYAADRVQTSPENSLESAAWRMLRDREKYTRKIGELSEAVNEHLMAMREMSRPLYAEILFKRYWECKPLRQVGVETGKSYQTIRNEHGKALTELEKKINSK